MSIVSGTFNQTLTSVSRKKSKDTYGDTTASVMYSNVKCRWNERNGKVVSENMEIIDYTIDAWVEGTYTIAYNYEVVYDGKTYKVVAFENKRGLSGSIDHVRLYLK